MAASNSNGVAIAVVLVICGGLLFTYMKDSHFTPDRQSANSDVHQAAAELTNVHDLVAQLKTMVGDEGLRNLAKHENLPGEKKQDKAAPSLLKNLRAKGVFYGLSNKDISKMSQEEITLSMYSTLDQTSTVCHRKLRMGNIGDGGWEICDDADVRPRQPCIIYSFGIDYDWSFDDKISQTYGCHVYSFDPSIKQETYNRSRLVHFYKVGLGGKTEKTKNGWQLYSYKDLRKMLGHENTPIDIVKMDIEHAEWPSVKQMFDVSSMNLIF